MRFALVTSCVLLTLGCRHEFPDGGADQRADTVDDTRQATDGQAGCAKPCRDAIGRQVAPGMCVCDTLGKGITFAQCNASGYCPETWLLCSHVHYRNRFHSVPPPSHATDAWLEGCVASNALAAASCSSCNPSPCSLADTLAFTCGDEPLTLTTPKCALALASHIECTGFSGAGQNEAYWRLLPSDSSLSRVLCCSPL